MKFNAEFVTSVHKVADCAKDGKPEIALLGRSNVGKSSLINALVERRNLAKTSSTPGKTQLLNYFLLNSAFYFVDMPGYGYAKAAKTSRLEWAKLSQDYLIDRQALRVVLLLVDARHPSLDSDEAAMEWLTEAGVQWAVVLTKIDKIKQQEVAAHVRILRERHPDVLEVFKTSSSTGRGLNELRAFISQVASKPLEQTEIRS